MLRPVIGRRFDPGVVGVAPLQLGRPRPITAETLLDDPAAMLAAVELGEDRAAFVLVDAPEQVLAHPFLYEAQRARAHAVVEVPLARLLEWAERLGAVRSPILLYSTARSGSTLLVRALDRITGLRGVSEPDAFTQLAEHPGFVRDPRAAALLRACTTMLFGAGRRDARLALKFRTQVLAIAAQLQAAWPSAPAVFLRRPLVASVESYAHAFVGARRWRLEATPLFRAWLRFRIARDGYGIAPQLWPAGRPDAAALAALGPAYHAVAYWLSACGWVTRLRTRGAELLELDYDALVAAPHATVARLLADCGEDPRRAVESLPAFAEPSQRGAQTVRARGTAPRLRPRDAARLREFLRRHGAPYGVEASAA